MRPVAVSSTMVKSSGLRVGCGRVSRSRVHAATRCPSASFSPWISPLNLDERFRVLRRGTAHDQAVAKVTQNSFLFGEHDLSCRAMSAVDARAGQSLL